ncbi:sulfotransferase [Reinekea marinisedimentorum]|uniref:Sulfotransferase family protein n=1 Tax=Reinekea marinisedimentorum TaxID=230495 RepID=A0A4R3I5D1_9GAMM|nr:sulfotransferase [Reinekea marinisedimentorum]TCS40153.1 sulfotransferase family protein [Reinekea marinisedimentorum]
MGNGFWLAVGQMCQLCFWTVRYLPAGHWKHLPRRALAFGLAIPVYLFFQCLHWLGFALDEILFRNYRKVDIQQPVFVTGIPRSGTTHLQRVLARHEQLTSMQTWECFFAPSISERYFYSAIGAIFKPAGRLFSHVNIPFLEKMRSVHKLGLNEAEEDFIALMPVNACFLLVVLFPEVKHYWALTGFDQQVSESRKATILRFYRRIIQKHLYFHGTDRRYLCKNPSFLSWVGSLSAEFEDARFVVCEREVDATLPSQISSLRPAWQLVYGEDLSAAFSERIIQMMAGYYHYLDSHLVNHPSVMLMPMHSLVQDLQGSVAVVLSHCKVALSDQFAGCLEEEAARAKSYRSSHKYNRSGVNTMAHAFAMFPKHYVGRFYKREVAK